MDKKDTEIVVYLQGEPLFFDQETKQLRSLVVENYNDGTPIIESDRLKDRQGKYLTEVKSKCYQMYLSGMHLKEISDQTGVE